MSADEVGPEIPVVEAPAVQGNVAVDNDGLGLFVAFEEVPAGGGLSRIVLHRYMPLRTTEVLPPSSNHQRRPVVTADLLAYVEETPDGTSASLLWRELQTLRSGLLMVDVEEVAKVKPGTAIEVFRAGLFFIVWTAPEGNLKCVERKIGPTAIAYWRGVRDVTYEPGVNPAAADSYGGYPGLIAYNTPGPSGRYRIRATTAPGPYSPNPAIDIAPEGASAPKVVFDGTSFVVFWTMEEEGVTYARRVSTADGKLLPLGEPRKIHDGVLHDATIGPGKEYYLAVDEGVRYAVLRLDRQLALAERTPFYANPADGALLSISADDMPRQPVLTYPDFTSRAVLRVVEDQDTPRRRRSTR